MISLFDVLMVSLVLFALGCISLVINKNILFIFISLEIIMNSMSVALVSISNYCYNIEGQIFYIVLITLSGIEISISLLLLIKCYHKRNILNIDKLSEIGG